jgi:hypothetical protein
MNQQVRLKHTWMVTLSVALSLIVSIISGMTQADVTQSDKQKYDIEQDLHNTVAYTFEKPDEEAETIKLQWTDEETGLKLFGIDDIVRFDWDKQIFELTRPAAMNILANLNGLSKKFIIADDDRIIYQGTFVSPLASMTFHGPIIMMSLLDENSIQPPLFEIQDGYPPSKSSESDQRFSKRLKEALDKAGLSGKIDTNNPPAPIKKDSYGWFGEKGKLRAWVDVFPETFRIGESACVHLHFTGSDYLEKPDCIIGVNTFFAANKGKFKYTTDRIFPTRKDEWKNIYIMEVNPWTADEGSVDKTAIPGSAEVSFEMCIRNINTNGNSFSEPIESIKTDPIQIVILPEK